MQVVSVPTLSQLEANEHSQCCLGSGLTHFHTFSTRKSGTNSLCCLKQPLSPLAGVYALHIAVLEFKGTLQDSFQAVEV